MANINNVKVNAYTKRYSTGCKQINETKQNKMKQCRFFRSKMKTSAVCKLAKGCHIEFEEIQCHLEITSRL